MLLNGLNMFSGWNYCSVIEQPTDTSWLYVTINVHSFDIICSLLYTPWLIWTHFRTEHPPNENILNVNNSHWIISTYFIWISDPLVVLKWYTRDRRIFLYRKRKVKPIQTVYSTKITTFRLTQVHLSSSPWDKKNPITPQYNTK